MKINLIYAGGDILQDHLNLSPFSIEETANEKICDLADLSPHVDDGEAERIVAINVLSYYPLAEIQQIVGGWIKKLALGGTLIIGEPDIEVIANLFTQSKLNTKDINGLLYTNQDKNYIIKRSCLTIFDIQELVQMYRLKIIKQRLDGVIGIIEAVRE